MLNTLTVIAITDSLVPYPNTQSAFHKQTWDYVVAVDEIGDPKMLRQNVSLKTLRINRRIRCCNHWFSILQRRILIPNWYILAGNSFHPWSNIEDGIKASFVLGKGYKTQCANVKEGHGESHRRSRLRSSIATLLANNEITIMKSMQARTQTYII